MAGADGGRGPRLLFFRSRIGLHDTVTPPSFLGCEYPQVGIYSDAMKDSMLAYVLAQLQETKGHWAVVAKKTGISKRTIEKIAGGQIEDPGVRKIERLAEYFRASSTAPLRPELRP